jgi:hypothetical protein
MYHFKSYLFFLLVHFDGEGKLFSLQKVSKHIEEEAIRLFFVEVKVPNSKKHKGVRAEAYRVASRCGAFYNVDKDKSFYYDGPSLKIKLLFESVNCCSTFLNTFFDSLEYFQLCDDTEKLESTWGKMNDDFKAYPPLVFLRDYKTEDHNSLEHSLYTKSTLSTSYAVNIDESSIAQMIEDPQHYDFIDLLCYRCHLKSTKGVKTSLDALNENNVLYLSAAMHSYFDGMNTVRNHMNPSIAISPLESNIEKVTLAGVEEEREKVVIAIEAVNDRVFAAVKARLKPGFYVEDGRIITWVFVKDSLEFKKFLNIKYKITKNIWKESDNNNNKCM